MKTGILYQLNRLNPTSNTGKQRKEKPGREKLILYISLITHVVSVSCKTVVSVDIGKIDDTTALIQLEPPLVKMVESTDVRDFVTDFTKSMHPKMC